MSRVNRDGIKEVAAAMFAERGYHATTLRHLAAKAGVTLGTLYHYFPSKEQLLLELIDDAMTPLMDSIPYVEAHAEEDPPATLAWMIRQFLLGTLQRLGTAIISDTELRALKGATLSRALAKRQRYQTAMEMVVQAGVEQGLFHGDDLKLAVFAILAMCSGVPRWYRPDGPASPEAISSVYEGLALRMVGYTESVPASPAKRSAGARERRPDLRTATSAAPRP